MSPLLGSWEERLAATAGDPCHLAPARLDVPRASSSVRVVRTVAEAEALLNDLRAAPLSAVAVDSEYQFSRPGVPLRSGKTWYDIRSQRPICVSLAAWSGDHVIRAVLDARAEGIVPVLGEILRLRVPFIFHHVKAELFTFWALGLDPEIPQLWDTWIAGACLHLGEHHKRARRAARDELEAEGVQAEADLEREHQHLLSLVGQCHYYGLAYPLSESKEDLRDIFMGLGGKETPTDRMVEYAAADAEWTLRLYVAQQEDVLRGSIQNHLHSVEFPFAIANARMEWRGVHSPVEARAQLREGAQRAADRYAQDLAEMGIAPAGSRDAFLRVMASAGLAQQFRKGDRPSTEDSVLRSLEHVHRAVTPFRLQRYYRRLAGDEWLTGALDGADGRVHPQHRQLGAATGRNACSQPNLAGLPRILRPAITAPRGRALIEIDYSQIEVGVAAAEHGDPDLIAAFNGADVYAAMAQRFYADELSSEEQKFPPEEFKRRRPDLRGRMKTLVLAIIYNIQAPGIATRFGITTAQAERERERFLDLFPVLKRGLEDSVSYGLCRGYASTATGLRRRAVGSRRAGPWVRNYLRNTPIQGSAAVIFKRAIILLDRAFRGTDTWLVMPVHDAVLIECPANDVEQIATKAVDVMGLAVREVYPVLQPKLDVNRSQPWCWNKDGHADSLDSFLSDPTITLDAVHAPLPREAKDLDREGEESATIANYEEQKRLPFLQLETHEEERPQVAFSRLHAADAEGPAHE